MMNYEHLTEDQIEEIYLIIDENGDGQIEMEELAQNIELVNDLLVHKYNVANREEMEKSGTKDGTGGETLNVTPRDVENWEDGELSPGDGFIDAIRPANFIKGLKKNLKNQKKKNQMLDKERLQSEMGDCSVNLTGSKGDSGRSPEKKKSKDYRKEPLRASLTLDAFAKTNVVGSKLLLPMANLMNQINLSNTNSAGDKEKIKKN